MKKPNRRPKRTSVTDSSSPAKYDVDDNPHRRQEAVPKMDSEKRLSDLELENRSLKREILELKSQVPNASPASSNRSPKLREVSSPNLHALQEQVTDLKKKVEAQYQLSMQKVRTSEGRSGPQDEIQRLKAQKVQLLCKMKLESVQFRLSKASLEKEVLQLKKEQWRYKYEMRKLLALNQSQKLVLQRKTEEASTAAKRLNDLLESRKNLSKQTTGGRSENSPGTQGIEFEMKLAARVEEIRSEYERQMEEMADELRKYEEEAETLREENFRLMLQDKEFDCIARESELKDLKDEVIRLSNMVARMATQKTQQAHTKRQQMDIISASLSAESRNEVEVATSGCREGSVAGVRNSASGACCSCSKKSLCKTLKCECRAAGEGCGLHCGCSTAKCSNRTALQSKEDVAVQQVEFQNLTSWSGSSEKENNVTTCEPPVMKDASEPRRKVLQDVGNMQDNPAQKKPGRKTKKQKSLIQVDSADLPVLHANDADCLNKTGKMAGGDIPKKMKRVTRAAVAEGIS